MRLTFSILLTIATISSCQSSETLTFIEKQQTHPRVQTAIEEKDDLLRRLFEGQRLTYPPKNVYIRVFKREKILEVWIYNNADTIYKKVNEYTICRTSGDLGPKRQEGDFQIPEGFYYIDRFNPESNFYLSLGINYPNQSDRIMGKQADLGSDIFIHGGCVTVGCIPLTDDKIKEVYWLAVQAKSNGQQKIPVHIFPAKLDNTMMSHLQKTFPKNDGLIDFWTVLKVCYDWFETHKKIPEITVNREGIYQFSVSLIP